MKVMKTVIFNTMTPPSRAVDKELKRSLSSERVQSVIELCRMIFR